MSPVNRLRRTLATIKPVHDSPIGLIHPYWARKPLNIIKVIIESLTEVGDTIADPFVGSGTVAFAALSSHRKVIASDLNPLACLLTKTNVLLALTPKRTNALLREYLQHLHNLTIKWFSLPSGYVIERRRFQVSGTYENGEFSLTPVEIVATTYNDSKYSGRMVLTGDDAVYTPKVPGTYLHSPVDFRKLRLIPNSRIAVPKGAKLSHYFTPENIAFINLSLREIPKFSRSLAERTILTALISSVFPLLRLSDKKASSQWPYWRPKLQLTSRNPLIVLNQRVQAFQEAGEWGATQLDTNSTKNFILKKSAVQDLFHKGIKQKSVDLVLTDPPYADQAPYLEYSSMWNLILRLGKTERLISKEIVKTDAPTRREDSDAYAQRLCKGFKVCCEMLKPGGHLAFFYQDRDLNNWRMIARTLATQGVLVRDIVPLPKQRRSMKTVTTPGRTLDGDLLIIAERVDVVTQSKSVDEFAAKHICDTKESIRERLVRQSDLSEHALRIRDCFARISEDFGSLGG